MIAKGEFAAQVVEANLTVAQTGTEQVAVRFRLLEGPDEGSTIVEFFALTDNALAYTVEKLRTCGWGDDLGELSGMIDTKVRLVIKHEDSRDGKTRARVQFVNAFREAPKLSADQAAGVASKWKDKIAAIKAASGEPAVNGQTKAPF